MITVESGIVSILGQEDTSSHIDLLGDDQRWPLLRGH